MRRKRKYGLLLGLLPALFLSGCASVRISQIKSDPARYQNKTVRVDGTVTTSVGLLSRGAYEIEDSTGRIYVLSSRGIPAKGARVRVEGRVFSGAMVLGEPIGLAIRENKHQVK